MYPVTSKGAAGAKQPLAMQYLNEILTYLVGPGAAAFLGWFFGRRKASAEADAAELDNVEKGLGIYRKIIEDVIKGQEELRVELKSIKEENASLQAKLAQIEVERESFRSENKGLRTENENLRKRIGHMEKEIEELKKQQND